MYLLYQADLQSKTTHPHFPSVLAAPAKFNQIFMGNAGKQTDSQAHECQAEFRR